MQVFRCKFNFTAERVDVAANLAETPCCGDKVTISAASFAKWNMQVERQGFVHRSIISCYNRRMTEQNQPTKTKICPTCGTRMNVSATRCLVCGRVFAAAASDAAPSPRTSTVQVQVSETDAFRKRPRLPEIRLSLPIAVGLLILIFGVGAGLVFVFMQSAGMVVEPTERPTQTGTPTISPTPTTTYTPTLEMSPTPLAPIEYVVKESDLCNTIAATFNVSIQTIILENNLSASCFLSPGQVLRIPQPTITPTPLATGTLTERQATLAACGSYDYIVNAGDTLMGIALNYGVTTDIIRQYNGLVNDNVVLGAKISIPLCEQVTPGPTATATYPPPYDAPNLLLPADGASYNTSGDTITLQWAGVGTLLENEAYEVNVEDITQGTGRKMVRYVKDTKFIVPVEFRPSDPAPHAIKWYVQPVRQTGSQEDGSPIYSSAGSRSDSRTFIWSGVAIQ